jgi:translation initiation factor IF-1
MNGSMMIGFARQSSKVIGILRGFSENLFRRACARLASGLNLPWNMPDATIHTCGRVLDTLGPVLYRISLPNGKIILAHLSRRLTIDKAAFSVGENLLLELTPYDFDSARILGTACPP